MVYLVLFVVSIVLTGIFAGFETAYVSTSRLRTIVWLKGKISHFVSSEPQKVLISDLLCTNLFSVSASIILTVFLIHSGHSPKRAVVIAGTITTLSILFLGEIIPKSIGRTYPIFFIRRFSPIIYYFHIALSPFSKFFEIMTRFALKKGEEESALFKTEFEKLIELAKEDGTIGAFEEYLFKEALYLLETPSESLMLPREKIFALSLKLNREEFIRKARDAPTDRIVVYGDDLDNIYGVLHIKDLFFLKERNKSLQSVLKPVIFSFRDWSIGRVLNELRKIESTHVVVVDEHGVTVGLLTLEFVVERLFESLERPEKGKKNEWILPGTVRMVSLKRLGIPFPTTEVESLAGLIIEQIGRIPAVGEEGEIGSIWFKILDADEKTVKKVLLRIKGEEM